MILTQELIEAFAPEHDRTSCDDTNLSNSFGGWNGKYDENTGRKKILFPRCNRCYLMVHNGQEIDDLEFVPKVRLEWRDKQIS